MKSDIIIIGGGAAGLLAGIGAARALQGAGTVTILEMMPRAGRKIMITGKGRCNFTNVKGWDDFSAAVRSGSALLNPAFHNLPPEAVINLLKENGMRSTVERGDRAFPESHLSSDVVDTLIRACTLEGVKIITGCEVRSISHNGKLFSLDCTKTTVKEFRSREEEPRRGKAPATRTETTIEQEVYTTTRLIITTGGLSYPGTGSTGDGYKWASELGHSVTPLLPSLTALVPAGYKQDPSLASEIKEAFRGRGRKPRKINPLPENYPTFKAHIERITPMTELGEMLCGNNLDNIDLSLYIGGECVATEFGDLEFTDGGIEGPAGYKISRAAVRALENGARVNVSIDLKPAVEAAQLDEDVHKRWEDVIADERSRGVPFRKLFRILLGKFIPWNLTLPFLKMNPQVSIDTLAATMKDWRFDIEGFVGFERAVVTAGGIPQDEIVAKTLESKLVPGLYFAGEILDLDCDTGGYNLQSAFSTGYLAGQSAALSL